MPHKDTEREKINTKPVMSNKTKVGASPGLTFKAGGSPSPSKRSFTKNGIPTSPSFCQPFISKEKNIPPSLSVIQTGLAAKRSPFQIKNWIACVLTLDGRDKFTKVLQYSSRLLCWYFAGLAKKSSGLGAASSGGSSIAISSGMASLLSTIYTNAQLRQQYYTAISKRFEALYKSLVTSRKAFRMGRSIIEMDKIASMGWGDYLEYMLLHPLAGGVAGGGQQQVEDDECRRNVSSGNTLARYDTHPIPEEEGEEGEDDEESSWNGDEQSDDDEDGGEEKKSDSPTNVKKVVARPDRPHLPTKISSNIGWGPQTTSPTNAKPRAASGQYSPKKPPPSRTVSEMGRQMYKAFPSRSSSMGSYKQLNDNTSMALQTSLAQPPTPAWKLIGGTMKLLGLMGFWFFDNISFVTGSGFLDPIINGGDNGTILVNPKAVDRMKRKKRASELAGRCYFAGSIGGLYVNVRAIWEHRNGKLKDAQERLVNASTEEDIKEAHDHLHQTKKKHFELSLALLKSCCDFTVFSNNPGIDLHLKYRGKKNHEGLHCLAGLTSAGTVLYNNWPNAK